MTEKETMKTGDVSKANLLSWIANAIEAIEGGMRRRHSACAELPSRYIAECQGKVNVLMLIREKIINGQFLQEKDNENS